MVKRSTLVLGNAWLLAALSIFAVPEEGHALSEGDISLIGMQTAGDTTTPRGSDSFTFVTIVDLEPGTRIYFTDNGYMGSGGFYGVNTNDLNGAEGLAFFEVSAGHRLRAGSVVSSVSITDPSYVWRWVDDLGTVSPPTAGMSLLSLNNSSPGDQIYAFQTTATKPLLETSSQQHLSAISTNPNWIYVGGSGNFSATSTGALPSNLTEDDPVVYKPPTFQSGAVYFDLQAAGNQLRTKEEWWTALSNENGFWNSKPSSPSSSFVLPTTSFKMSGGIDLSWNGGSGTWDTTTANWKDTGGNTTRFLPMDHVTFGGNAGGTVSVDAAVVAGNFVINNSGTAYNFTGASVSAASLVKSGTGPATVDNNLSLTGSVVVDNGTLTLTGNNTYEGTTLNGGTLVAGNDAALGAGAVTLNGGSLASNNDSRSLGNGLVVNNTAGNKISGANNLTLTGGATGPGALQVALENKANALTVSGATFAPGEIDVNKGSLLLGASNVLGDSTRMRLSGGTLDTGGYSDSVGALTLSFDSTIDLGSGSSVLQFANSRGETWSGVLLIDNWSGSKSGGGVDRIFFGGSFSDEVNAGITLGQSAAIFFYNPEGLTPGYYSAQMLSTGELVPKDIVPVPEMNPLYACGALISFVLWQDRRKKRVRRR